MQTDPNFDTFIKELTAAAEAKTDSTYFVLISSGNTHALDYFGLKEPETPAFVIQAAPSKYIKKDVKPKDVSGFYKDFKVPLNPLLVPYAKSQAIYAHSVPMRRLEEL